MFKYNGINHVALVTSDMDKTIRFWRDLLGMKLIAGLGKPGRRQYFFKISENNLLSFFEWSEVEPIEEKDAGRAVKGPLAFDHLCLELEDKNNLWTLKDSLEAAEIWTTEVLDYGFIHSFFTFDPNNIALEFCYRVQGFDIHKKQRMIDSVPSDVTKEGTEPQKGKWPEVQEPTLPEKRKIYPGDLRHLFDPLTSSPQAVSF